MCLPEEENKESQRHRVTEDPADRDQSAHEEDGGPGADERIGQGTKSYICRARDSHPGAARPPERETEEDAQYKASNLGLERRMISDTQSSREKEKEEDDALTALVSTDGGI